MINIAFFADTSFTKTIVTTLDTMQITSTVVGISGSSTMKIICTMDGNLLPMCENKFRRLSKRHDRVVYGGYSYLEEIV